MFQRRITRRGVIGGIVAVAIVATVLTPTVASATSWPPSGSLYKPIPAAATKVPIGDIPAAPCEPTASPACQGAPVTLDTLFQNIVAGGFPLDVSGLGIPVGGVGAGAFMINQDGTFGPWNFGGSQDGTWENRILPQAAFHIREQLGSSPASVTTLAAKGPNVVGTQGQVTQRSWGSPLPAWNVLKPGQGTYSALYPFGWESYTGLSTNASLMFYSPIVAGEDKDTSLPAVYFDVRLTNPTRKNDKVSMMFTMPNAPAHTSGAPASVRQGYTSTFTRDPRTGVEAVTLGANSPQNTPDAANSSWTIAAKPAAGQRVSYTTSWNADGDGSDVYAPFTKSGTLPNRALDKSDSAGAIAVSADLAPGETTTIPFALTWDFPQVSFANNQTTWMRRYTDFYGAREDAHNNYIAGSYTGSQSFNIANDALTNQTSNLAKVENWYDPIANDSSYPLELRTGALNQLSNLVMSDSFWEGGLVSNSVPPTGGQRLGSQIPGTHLFDTTDSAIPWTQDSDFVYVNNANELDVDAYGYLAYNKLFPNLEKDRLLAQSESAMLDPYGGATQIYDPTKNPFVTWPESTAPTPGVSTFIDIPSKNIYRDYAYATINHDTKFLQQSYPAMQKQLRFLEGLIPSGSSLPEAPPQYASTYDGGGINQYEEYSASLYVLALETMQATGRKLGASTSELAALGTQLSKAKAQFESTFWDQAHHAYRYTLGSTGNDYSVLFDSFFAENVAQQLGLPDVLDVSHMREQLSDYYGAFTAARDSSGTFVGAPVSVAPLGTATPPGGEVWSGSNYEVASTYINVGKRLHDPALVQDGLTISKAIANQIWHNPANGFAFDAPEAWHDDNTKLYRYPDYSRALAVWDDLDALKALHPANR